MKNPWTHSEKKQTAQRIAEMLCRNGLPCKAVREAGGYTITDPRGLIEHARLEFLPSGDLACIARGFKMTDTPFSLSKFAAAILGKSLPDRAGDMTQYNFRQLESRSMSH